MDLTAQFHEYLYSNYFDVFIDLNLLTYVLTTAKLDATGDQWVASLANYIFTLNYKSRKINVDVDALSRIPWHSKMEPAELQAIMKATMSRGRTFGEALSCSAHTAEELKPKLEPGRMTLKYLEKAQENDVDLKTIRHLY